MSREKPNTYTAKFRASAVKLANGSSQSITGVAKELGINANTLKLVNDALLFKRKPANEGHRGLLKQYGFRQSMSRKGNCWESLPLGYNAVSESFFHTLKTELIHQQQFLDREEARQAVFEYIEVFYNRERLHSANSVCPRLSTHCSKRLLKLVSGKVLTHQAGQVCLDKQWARAWVLFSGAI